MAALHDPQEQKKKSSSRREERLKFSAGGSGTGVLIGCALIAAGIGAAFVAHTARSFSNRGKSSSRRNCRKDDRTDQSVDRIDDDTVDYLVGVQRNTNEKSEIIVGRREMEIMAKLEQDVKIPSIKFREEKESSDEGKGEKGEEGSEGRGGSSTGSDAEQLWSAEVIEQEMKHDIIEEPAETLEGESCSDSSLSSQRDTLTESEESEESQITCKNFEMAIITRESELGNSTDGGEDVVQDWGHNSSTPESLEDIQKTSSNSEIALESLRRHRTYENPEVVMETRESQFIDNMEDASDLVQERSFHNVKFSKILQDEINQTWDEFIIGNIEEEGSERIGISSMEPNDNVVHQTDLIDQVKVSESVNTIKEEEEEERSPIKLKEEEREAPIVEEHVRVQEGSEATGNTSEESNDDVIYPAELIHQLEVSESDANKVEEEGEEGSLIKPKEQEREAPFEEEHVTIEEGIKGSTNSLMDYSDDVVHPVELVDLVKVSESVNVNIQEEEEEEEEEVGSPIKSKEQEREAPVEEEHVTIEEGMKGSINSFLVSSNYVVHPVELVDIVKVSESVNDSIQEEGSPIKSKVQEREAPVEEEHMIVEEGLEGIENPSMVSNSKTIHPAEVSDQVKISVLVNVNNEEEENDNKGSPKKSKEQEREASVEEENVREEEGLERTQKSFVESNNKAIHPAKITDQMKVSESINVKDGEEREAPVDKEHAVVEEGSTTNSSMESNDDQVKVSECVNGSKKIEEKSPKESKEEQDQVIRSEETGNSCKEPNDHLAELIDQVKVLELVNNTRPQLDIEEKFEDTVAPAEAEYEDKTTRALENHLHCTNLEKRESSVDSSTTIQNADMNSEAVQESVADKEFSTTDVNHYICEDQEKPEISNVKEENLSKEIPENETKPLIEEVGDRVEGSEVVGDSSTESNNDAISSMSSYRVFILVLLALGVALGLIAFAHPDNLPNIYQQLSRLLFPSGCNVVGEL